ncbi:hypothetical protein BGW38_007009 [Lunasporangiospora selenospora]|uniref:Pirin n=1 Tax=Lunasporangiospora selenospora TaxID=979761 RepID=A0A9P6G0X1_9FUNG|nr:hypothetical protein BGW38_007009 [Lunasporangiospora selenospora]
MIPSRVSRWGASLPSWANRYVTQSIYAAERPEGIGATVRRSLGTRDLRQLDPFLLLDEFSVEASNDTDQQGNKTQSGFPDHPHRGFETVTYMLKGQMKHEDFAGHKGTIQAGDVQWMTAGRGIMHAEMPVASAPRPSSPSSSIVHGLQLWVNLSSKDKMCQPHYQDLLDKAIPKIQPHDGIQVKVIAGQAHGIESNAFTRNPTTYLDYHMDKNQSVRIQIPKHHNGFVYVLSGKVHLGGDGPSPAVGFSEVEKKKLRDRANIKLNDHPAVSFEGLPHHALILSRHEQPQKPELDSTSDDDTLFVQTKENNAHFVVLTGEPLQEPVVQDRLFVMNTQEEVRQALEDFREFKNGFESAKDWRSTIAPKGYRLKF